MTNCTIQEILPNSSYLFSEYQVHFWCRLSLAL